MSRTTQVSKQVSGLSAAFVVTVSLSACDRPLPGNPPEVLDPPDATPTSTASATATSTAGAAPTATATVATNTLPAPAAGERIMMDAEGTCTQWRSVSAAELNCPPTALCNPPPPREEPVACPEIPERARVEKTPGDMCQATWFPPCPPHTKCNPPPVQIDLPCDRAPKP